MPALQEAQRFAVLSQNVPARQLQGPIAVEEGLAEGVFEPELLDGPEEEGVLVGDEDTEEDAEVL